MRRIWPDSLFGRLAWVLFVGLILAQAGSALINARELNHLLRASDQRQWLERIAAAIRLVDLLPAAERPPALPALAARRLTLALDPGIAPVEGPPSRQMQQELSELLGPDFAVRAWEKQGPEHLLVQVRLHDGSDLLLDYRPENTLDWPQTLFWRLGLLLAAALGLTLLATRVALHPLDQLTRAAERLGENLEAPPLAAVGTREVRQAAHAFNRMQARIRKSVIDRSRLLVAVSHDLKTPLTRLRLRAEFIQDAELRAVLTKEVDTMQAMTQSVLSILRGGGDEPRRNVDINALVEGLAADAIDLGAQVTIHGRASTPCAVRSLALRRALANLLDNARSYAKGPIEITVHEDPRQLTITVADRGPGIPEADQARMLEPFQRMEPSRNAATGGSGLGLAIARSVAEAHGGELALRNRFGGGLEVQLRVPTSDRKVLSSTENRPE
ncbi:ATP-binding protein [Variovorax sp.]|uniref:ATP-binding protein n=1 Tax=Variovorax sp. TaxID=1871043 RepID=UPI000C4AFC61|nr:ATP-binding protein [Variovorax sp.]MBS82219.1 hypothetical protein [Variovorax sp.]